MKRPMQAIKIAENEIDDIKSLKKNAIILEGHWEYKLGSVLLCCPVLEWCVQKSIASIHQTSVKKITVREYEAAGFKNQVELLEGLQEIYPKIEDTSLITVLKWE